MQPDQVTSSVRALYETFPYPERIPDGASDPYLDLILSFSAQPPQGRSSFLDAGCGTGVNLLGGAMLYPHFDTFGCDINRVALASIAGDLRKHNLARTHLLEAELSEFPEDFGPKRGFDVIFCTGVLHHLSNPLEALTKLAKRLAPQGVLRLLVYSQRGRHNLYRFAQVAQKLWPASSWSWVDRVSMARTLMQQLEEQGQNLERVPPPLRGTWTDAASAKPAEFADRYLHPYDRPYTPANLRTLIDDAGLRVLNWFEPRDWDLPKLLPLFEHGFLDFWEETDIVDSLFERPCFDLYLVGPKFVKHEPKVTPSSLLATNPQLFLEQVSVRGLALAQAARLRRGPTEPLTKSEGRLITSLSQRYASLEMLDFDGSLGLDDHQLSEAQSLVDRGFLFIPHPPNLEATG